MCESRCVAMREKCVSKTAVKTFHLVVKTLLSACFVYESCGLSFYIHPLVQIISSPKYLKEIIFQSSYFSSTITKLQQLGELHWYPTHVHVKKEEKGGI